MRSLILLIITLGLTTAAASSQEAPVDRPMARLLTTEHGLSQNTVLALSEDSAGRLWIGTQDGIDVVDANTIVRLQALGTKSALRGKVIRQLIADQHHGIWALTNGGLHYIDTRDLRSRHVDWPVENSDSPQIAMPDPDHLLLLRGPELWLYDIVHRQWSNLQRNLKSARLHVDAHSLLLQVEQRFYQLSASHKLSAVSAPALSHVQVRKAIISGTTLWVQTADFALLQCDTQVCLPWSFPDRSTSDEPNQSVRAIHAHQQQLFILLNDRIVLLDTHTGESRQIMPQLHNGGFRPGAMPEIMQWLSSGELAVGRDRGLLTVPLQVTGLSSYPFNPDQPLLAITTWGNSPHQQLLVARDQQLQVYQSDHTGLSLTGSIQYPQPLVPILFNRLGDTLLMTTANTVVQQVDLVRGEIKVWNSGLPDLPELRKLVDVQALQDGYFLLLFKNTLVLLQQQARQWRMVWTHRLPVKDGAQLLYQHGQLLIAAYYDGVMVADWSDWRTPPAHWQFTSSADPVLGLRRNSAGEILQWSAEQAVRLLRRFKDGWQAQELPAVAKMPNQTIVCSTELPNGDWLAASHAGVGWFSRQHQRLMQLTRLDGLVSDEFNQYNCGQLNQGVYLASQAGISLLMQPTIKPSARPKLHWSTILADGEIQTSANTALELTEPSLIEFSYSYGPTPVLAPVRFRYRLLPVNDQWFETKATTLRYTKLSSGQYHLQLQALNADGSLSDTQVLQLRVQPHVWRSPLAYVLYASSLFLVLYLYFRQRWHIQQAQLHAANIRHQIQQEHARDLEQAVQLRTLKLEQQQQQFRQLQQEKTGFLAATNHDMKNLSALIRLHLRELWPFVATPGQSHWHKTEESCKLLNKLADNMLELSKIDAGLLQPQLQTVQLSQLLQQIHQSFATMAAELQVQLDLSIEPEIAVVTDPALLSRMLMNLLDNALKNLQAGDQVQLQLKKRYPLARQCYLTVRDSGPGLPETIRQQWGFGLQRGTERYQGSGLGLGIVRKIAELLALPINLYSSASGTCFEFRFQLADPVSDQPEPTGQAVIIDNDPQVCQLLYFELARLGLQVVVFQSTEEFSRSALQDLRLLVVDVGLHASDAVIQEFILLKTRLNPARGTLLLISADQQIRQRLPGDPTVHFMLKPLKKSRLAWLLAQERR